MAKLFPIRVSVEVLLIRDDGSVAKVACTPKLFKPASEESLAKLVDTAMQKTAEQAAGFRPMTHAVVWDYALEERTGSGMRFATPPMDDGEEWWRTETDEVLAQRDARLLDEEDEEDA